MRNRTIKQTASSAVRDQGIRSGMAGLVVIGLLLLSRTPQAATGTLVPALYQTVLDSNGNPISGAKVCTYLAGGSTPTPTYADVALTVPNANPIIAETAGRWAAFLTPGAGYKFVLQDATGTAGICNGAIVRTIDNVVGTPSASIVTTGTWFPSLGGTTTYTSRSGTYVRIGAFVLVQGNLQINAIGTGSGTTISGLPFAVGTSNAPAVIGLFSGLTTPVVSIAGYGAAGSGVITMIGLVGAAAGSINGANLIGTGTYLDFSMTYITLAP